MLCELSIRNFAIIDDLKINFSEGLTILSGETGAGKSIIINAVNLLLGRRANAGMIRTGSETAELEALFEITPESIPGKIMADQGYDPSEGLVIRRIISRKDRHKIYINGRLGTIQVLTSITENLASISGQHAHQGLLKEDQHLQILDQYGSLMKRREKVRELYRQIIPLIFELKKLISKANQQNDQIELLKFQKKEITEADICLGEDEKLEQELLRLKNFEFFYQTVSKSVEGLYSAPGAVVETLTEIHKNLEKACEFDARLEPKTRGLSESIYQIEDISLELRSYLENVDMDETRLEMIESRLDVLRKLKRKYGGSLQSVLEKFAHIERELSGLENINGRIESIREQLGIFYQKLVDEVMELSMGRKQAAERLSRDVESEISSLKMSGTRFSVEISPIKAEDSTEKFLRTGDFLITENGVDRADFMIAPNVGETLKPLSCIASGGELSRIVLALKVIQAHTGSVETVVFDEVDAGIGGGTAEVVGKKLKELSRHFQIVCITHLPQIAKFGDYHYRISKQIEKGRTHTTIKPVHEEERIQEIARMLGGLEITQATLDHAREMLRNSQ